MNQRIESGRIYYDGLCKDAACEVTLAGDSGHMHGDAGWKGYWGGLSDEQREEIKRLARYSLRTLSATAIEYGAAEGLREER